MSDGRFDLFTMMIAQISKSIQKIKTKEMLKFGLRGTHVMCLFFLRRSGSGLTAAELAEQCGEDKAAVSRALALLEAKGYVDCPEPESKRKYRAKISLTDSGIRLTDEIDRIIEESVEKAGSGLKEAEREALYHALSVISGNLKKLAGD